MMISPKMMIYASVLFGIIFFGFFCGYKWQASKIERLKDTHKTQLAQIAEAAEKDLKERQDQINFLQREFTLADQKYHEDLQHAQDEIDKRDDDIRALRRVPTVKVKSKVCGTEGKNNNTGSLDATYRAELEPETAIRIFGIGDDGDKAIRQLTELQNIVRQLAKVCPIEVK